MMSDSGRTANPRNAIAAICAVAFLLAYAAQAALVVSGAHSQLRVPDWYATLPWKVVTPFFHPKNLLGVAWVALGIVQSALMIALIRFRPARAVIAVIAMAACMTAIDLRTTTMTTIDPYAYIGYAKSSTVVTAYAPTVTSIPTSFSVTESVWGTPIIPCVYGPIWLHSTRALLTAVDTVTHALITLRVANAAAFFALCGLLYRSGYSRVVISLIALNPALHWELIVNEHNDLYGMIALVSVFICMRRRLVLPALAFAIAAALIKTTMLLGALPLLGIDGATFVKRILRSAVVVFGAFLAALVFGGQAYLHAMASVGHTLATTDGGARAAVIEGLHAMITLWAIGAIAFTVLRNKMDPTLPFSMCGLGPAIYPNYFCWGLAAALVNGRVAALFLVLLPMLEGGLNGAFPGTGLITQVLLLGTFLLSRSPRVRNAIHLQATRLIAIPM